MRRSEQGRDVFGLLLDALSAVDHRRLVAAIEEYVQQREGC